VSHSCRDVRAEVGHGGRIQLIKTVDSGLCGTESRVPGGCRPEEQHRAGGVGPI